MGDLVDLEKYRNKKTAEEPSKIAEEDLNRIAEEEPALTNKDMIRAILYALYYDKDNTLVTIQDE